MDDFFGEYATPAERAAAMLVDACGQLLDDLRQARIDSGLTQDDVAERMGVPVERVAEFESYWVDPKLSELRHYANAIGVLIDYDVTAADLSAE